MIRGIHHAAISTANLDRLVAFYRDVMGFEPVDQTAWPKGSDLIDEVVGLKGSVARQVMLNAGNCYIEIFEYSAPEARPGEPLRACDRGYTHLCFDVTDIDAEYERLTKAGVKFNRAPPVFEGAGVRATYGRDPDGNIIEIQEVQRADVKYHPKHVKVLERTGS